MPDPQTDAQAQATPSADAQVTTPPPTQTPSPAAPSPDTTGHVTEADYTHPEFGAKIKNLHTAFQANSRELAELKRKAAEVETRYGRLHGVLNVPSVMAAVQQHFQGGKPAAPAPEQQPSEEDQAWTERKNQWMNEVKADQAMRDAMLTLGQGDLTKGQKLFDENVIPLNELLGQMMGDPTARMNLALEIMRLRSAGTATPPPPPPPPAQPSGSVNSETTRGAPQAAPAGDGRIRTPLDMLRAAGYNSPAEYLRDTGAFGS